MKTDRRFRESEHLRLRTDFRRVFAAKCSVGDGVLVVYVVRNKLTWSRLGISVGRRTGNAVQRNYIRRRIRETFRTSKRQLPASIDIICVARATAADRKANLRESFVNLVRKATRRLESTARRRSTEAPEDSPA